MSLFRKNYLPKGKIYRKPNGKYIFVTGEGLNEKGFYEDEEGYSITYLQNPTEFRSIKLLLNSLYEYAKGLHLKEIERELTFSEGIKV